MVTASERVEQRDVWLADLPEPAGLEAGFRRPIVIIQTDALNISRMRTCVAVPVTKVRMRKSYPWNVMLLGGEAGLEIPSVAQCNLILAVDQSRLISKLGRVTPKELRQLYTCLDTVLGRA